MEILHASSEFVGFVRSRQRATELREHIELPLEHDPARSVGPGDQAFPGPQTGGAERISRNGHLVLGAHPSRPPGPFLYFSHDSKGIAGAASGQRPYRSPSPVDATGSALDPLRLRSPVL